MLDIKFIRDNIEAVQAGLKAKNAEIDFNELMALDKDRRQLLTEVEELRAKQNAANDEISKAIQEKKDPKDKIAAMKEISSQISGLDPKIKEIEAKLKDVLIGIPNIPHASVPVGGVDKNEVVRSWGKPKTFDFKPKTHIEIAESLDIIDFKRATKLSGSNFILYKNEGARLERALFNFMLDFHTREHGYSEIFPPFVVNSASMTGTGQLPKMKEDMYKVDQEDLYWHRNLHLDCR